APCLRELEPSAAWQARAAAQLLPAAPADAHERHDRRVRTAREVGAAALPAALRRQRDRHQPSLVRACAAARSGTSGDRNMLGRKLLDPSKILRSLPEEPKPERTPYKVEFVSSGETNEAYVKAALDKATAAIFGAKDGERNNILNRESYAIGGLVAAQAITEAQARDAIMGAVQAAGWPLPRKNLATFERG